MTFETYTIIAFIISIASILFSVLYMRKSYKNYQIAFEHLIVTIVASFTIGALWLPIVMMAGFLLIAWIPIDALVLLIVRKSIINTWKNRLNSMLTFVKGVYK